MIFANYSYILLTIANYSNYGYMQITLCIFYLILANFSCFWL